MLCEIYFCIIFICIECSSIAFWRNFYAYICSSTRRRKFFINFIKVHVSAFLHMSSNSAIAFSANLTASPKSWFSVSKTLESGRMMPWIDFIIRHDNWNSAVEMAAKNCVAELDVSLSVKLVLISSRVLLTASCSSRKMSTASCHSTHIVAQTDFNFCFLVGSPILSISFFNTF